MKKNVWRALGIVLGVLMLIVAAVAEFKGGCTTMIECTSGDMPMKCHWTFTAVPYVAIVGTALGLCSAFMETAEGRRLAVDMTALTALAIIVIVSPAGIGTCAHADSLCNSTAMIVYVLCAIAIVLAIVMRVFSNPKTAEMPKQKL